VRYERDVGLMDKKEKGEKPKKLGILDIFDLEIFGMNIMDLITNVDKVRERIITQRDELERKLGDKVRVDLDFKVRGLSDGRTTLTAGTTWPGLLKEKTEWRKKLPMLKLTKEQLKQAMQELEREKQELEKTEKQIDDEETKKEE